MLYVCDGNEIDNIKSKIMKAMKTIIATIAMVCIFSNANSQSRIGFTFEEIRKDFDTPEYSRQVFKRNENDTGYCYLMTSDLGYFAYFFNEDTICNMTLYVPINDSIYNASKAVYDNTMKKIGSDKWLLCDDDKRLAVAVIYFPKKEDNEFAYFQFNEIKYE